MPRTPLNTTRIGILGGGQLGRMLAQSASPLGLDTAVLDPAGETASAGPVAGAAVQGDFKNAADVLRFIDQVRPDVLTVEIEHVNVDALITVERERQIPVYPTPATIALIQDKYQQKVHFRDRGVAVAPFRDAQGQEDILAAAAEYGYPLMLKSRRFAYDGRGNAVVRKPEDIESALRSLVSAEVYVEKWVPFVKELAVMVVRAKDGAVVAYPTVETIQKDNICHVVIAPAQIDGQFAQAAQRLAMQAIQTLDGPGVFGVEMFLLSDGSVFLNEVAPRVHNSGHYTIDACECSQFEQHLRVVAGLPLGSTAMKVNASIMLNILGNGNVEETFAPCGRALAVEGATLHWYNKGDARPARKMGHINIVGTSMVEVQQRLARIAPESTVVERAPLVGIIMGSDSDLPVMKTAAEILRQFDVPFELTIVSAHRTPRRMVSYASSAHERGLRVIIAAAGGAAHLPGMVASLTPLPVIGVPIALKHLDGVDSLHSIVQMPRGVPVATVAIDNPTNAALLAVRILGAFVPSWQRSMLDYQRRMDEEVHVKVQKLADIGWEVYKP